MEEGPIEAPNFYMSCAEVVFPRFSIRTDFAPNPKQSTSYRFLRSVGLGRDTAFAMLFLTWLLRNRRRFDVIMGWQAIVVFVGILRRMCGWRDPKLCAILYRIGDPAKRGLGGRLRRFIIRYGLEACEMLLAVDATQAVSYESELRRRAGRTRPLRYGVHSAWYEQFAENRGREVCNPRMIFCPGSAYRDEATFARAVADLDVEVRRYQLHDSGEMRCHETNLGRARLITFVNAPYAQYIEDCLRSAIVVIPVINEDRPAGLTSLLECMALGRPIIITRGMSSRDYVKENATGLLYQQGNWWQLRKQIVRLLDNPVYARALGAAAREEARTKFSLERSGASFAEILCCLSEVDD